MIGYNEAKRWSRHPEEFGHGAIEGVAGSEAANNSAVGGAMVPTLALGIPGSPTAAVILAGLMVHGLRPGPTRFVQQGEFAVAIFWSMLLVNLCGSHTFPYLAIKNPTATVEHEASTTKIGEDQIFYCNQRGLETEAAVSLIVNGFCKEVFKQLPMEFAVEAQKLLNVSLEGSVG